MKTWFWKLFAIQILCLASLLIAAGLTSVATANDSNSELQKINVLLDTVKSSDVIFIRNGNEYSAKDAHDHLQKKLKAAQSSWFAPSKDKWTAQLFIEKVATRSSLSGKPYLIRLKNGKLIEAHVWLQERLREIESKKLTLILKQ